MDEIRKIVKQIFLEFKNKHLELLIENIYKKRVIAFGQASIPEMGYQKKSGCSKIITTVNWNYIQQLVFIQLDHFKDRDLLNDFYLQIKKLGSYNFGDTDLETSFKKMPSVIFNLLSGFIVRVLELEKFKFEMEEDFFDIVFKELETILDNNYFEYKTLIGLYGIEGNITEFNCGDISIKKATKKIADLFCYHYYESDFYHEMIEGDYYLEIKRKAEKVNWQQELNKDGRNAVNKAIELIILCGNGYIERGKAIRICDDWSIVRTKKIIHKYRDYNSISNKNNFIFTFNNKVIESIEENYDYIFGKYSDKINESSILLAKKRLINAKKENDINDRIVELSLSLEYSIKTDRRGISKALREKSAVLFNYNDLIDYKKTKDIIRKFYEMRGDIIHGKKEIEYNDDNIKLIKEAENIIRNNLLLLIKLNKKYSIDEIDNTIKELFSDDPKTPLRNNLVL